MVELLGACRICTRRKHMESACNQSRRGIIWCGVKSTARNRCNKIHHTSLHISQSGNCQEDDSRADKWSEGVRPQAGIDAQLKCLVCKGGYRMCTSWKHAGTICHQRQNGVIACSVRNAEGVFGEEHHKILHLSDGGDYQAAKDHFFRGKCQSAEQAWRG